MTQLCWHPVSIVLIVCPSLPSGVQLSSRGNGSLAVLRMPEFMGPTFKPLLSVTALWSRNCKRLRGPICKVGITLSTAIFLPRVCMVRLNDSCCRHLEHWRPLHFCPCCAREHNCHQPRQARCLSHNMSLGLILLCSKDALHLFSFFLLNEQRLETLACLCR